MKKRTEERRKRTFTRALAGRFMEKRNALLIIKRLMMAFSLVSSSSVRMYFWLCLTFAPEFSPFTFVSGFALSAFSPSDSVFCLLLLRSCVSYFITTVFTKKKRAQKYYIQWQYKDTIAQHILFARFFFCRYS